MKHGIGPPVNLADLALTANESAPQKGHIGDWSWFMALIAIL
jgi:hypothetical protein